MPEPQFQLTLTHLPPDIPATMLGQTIRLKNLPTTIGRGKDAGITVKHRSLSRLHCRFYMTDGRLAVKDLASTNGTLINGYRITEDSFIQLGDHITFGSIVFQLSLLNASMPTREPESVPESSVPDMGTELEGQAANGAAQQAASNIAGHQTGNGAFDPAADSNQPATDQIDPITRQIGNPTPITPAQPTSSDQDVPLDLVQSASLANPEVELEGLSSSDLHEECEPLELPESDGEMDLAALIDDSGSDLANFSSPSDNGLEAQAESANAVPEGFKVDDSVVFFQSDPDAAGNEPERKTNEDQLRQAGEREMSVEGVSEREDLADLMKRHQLGQPSATENSQPEQIRLEDNGVSETPIIHDRHEDRPKDESDSDRHVIDSDLPDRSANISSVNIETSFVAGSSNVDLGDFMKDQLTGRPDMDDLVIEEPTGEGPSMTALGEFFKRKKD